MATQKQIKILKRVERNARPLVLECKEIIRFQQDVDAQALRAVTKWIREFRERLKTEARLRKPVVE